MVETRAAKRLRLQNGVSVTNVTETSNDNDINVHTKKRSVDDKSKIDYTKYLNPEFNDLEELKQVMNRETALEFAFFRYEPKNVKQYDIFEFVKIMNKYLNWSDYCRTNVNVRIACAKIVFHILTFYDKNHELFNFNKRFKETVANKLREFKHQTDKFDYEYYSKKLNIE